MLSRNRRLTKADFEIAFKKGRQLRHPLLTLRCYYPQDQNSEAQVRAAFVVPRKLAKAAQRNLWRRRMQHWFYAILLEAVPLVKQEELSSCKQGDFIFMLTASGMQASPQEVRQAMRILWNRTIHTLGHKESSCG